MSPGCNTQSGKLPADELGGCPNTDFGLVGAKIDTSQSGPGRLETNSAGCMGRVENGLCDGDIVPARDYLPTGQYYVDYRVQNFSANAANDDVDIRMTVDKTINMPGSSTTERSRTTEQFRNLSVQEVRTGRFSLNIDRADADYTVTLQVVPAGGSTDGFSQNNKKVFKFRAR